MRPFAFSGGKCPTTFLIIQILFQEKNKHAADDGV
jgi:hypothetical protein